MSIEKLLDDPLHFWMSGGGPHGDIALSSRIRLARNLVGMPFPNRADLDQLAAVVDQMRKSVNTLSNADGHSYSFIVLDQLSPLERAVLVEKHIISPNHSQQAENRALMIRDDAGVSIMVNEEDHLRIQCLTPGLDLAAAEALANRIDDALEAKNNFAFNENLGYLTACPTNLGTGLRASTMLHLPALVLTQQINRLVAAATQLGMTVRGLYGEGTEAIGNIFQVSNQLTLGYNEQEIVDNLQGVVIQIIDQERAARQALLENSRDAITDRVWRSYGVLRYARSISGNEALAMLSEVRLGVDLKIIDDTRPEIFNELLVRTRPNFLQKMAGERELDSSSRDRLRAQIIRDKLQGGK